MNKQELRQMKARGQRLETLISDFEDDVQILHDNGVDVSNSTEISERQTELQEEMEQAVSDLLALLDKSDQIGDEESPVSLPNNGRRPVSRGDLPTPNVSRPLGRGPPSWAGGYDTDNGNPGNGNGRGQ